MAEQLPLDDKLDDDIGVLLVNPRKRRRTKRRARRRARARRKATRRRRRRNPVLMTATNPSRRRRRRRPTRARRRTYRRRRNPFGLGGGSFVRQSTNILKETGAFLVGDMAGHAMTQFVWRKLGVGSWLETQQWALNNPNLALGLGRIAIGLVSEPVLKALKVPPRLRFWMVRSNVFAGALIATQPIKSKTMDAIGLGGYVTTSDFGVGDYMRASYQPRMSSGVSGYLGASLPSDDEVEASISYGGAY